MSTPLSARQRYLAEWYHPDLTREALQRRVTAIVTNAARSADGGRAVTLLTTFLLPNDEVVFGVFAADSGESVAEICRRSGYPAGRVSAAVEAAAPDITRTGGNA